jgi:hypothetical protein
LGWPCSSSMCPTSSRCTRQCSSRGQCCCCCLCRLSLLCPTSRMSSAPSSWTPLLLPQWAPPPGGPLAPQLGALCAQACEQAPLCGRRTCQELPQCAVPPAPCNLCNFV